MLYNNYVDVDVVLCVVYDMVKLVVVIIKYVNFCGIVIMVLNVFDFIVSVYLCVYECDLVLVYGGVIVVNGIVMLKMVENFKDIFIEVIVVFLFELVVFEVFKVKKNLCLL